MGKTFHLFRAVLVLALLAGAAHAQTGSVRGTVTDALSGDPLISASVRVLGTGTGAATDADGAYRIGGLSAGPTRFVASYIGFASDTLAATVVAGEAVTLDFRLAPEALLSEGVEVTAQLEGQLAAINQQRSSNTIVNVVSQDRIRELPDQNAAESVGRLSGVSLQRDGGEGSKVQVRGLNPALSSVTINGERIPGTDAADRSVDLSLISADLLAGIELFKALTPDKDADAIGGTVNLVVGNAPRGLRGDVRAQGGYGSLRGTYDNVRANGTLSNRFLDDRLGAILTANFQRADRSSEGFEQEFIDPGQQVGVRQSASVQAVTETRDRYGAGLTLDYELGSVGGVQLRSLYSRTDRDDTRQRNRYRVGELDGDRQLRTRSRSVDLMSVGLGGDLAFPALGGLTLTYDGSFSQAENRQPDGFEVRFRQTTSSAFGGLYDPLVDIETASIDELVAATGFNASEAGFNAFRRERAESSDRDVTARGDLAYPIRLGSASVELRAGGKYRGKERVQDETRLEFLASAVAGVDALTFREIAIAEGLAFAGGLVSLGPLVDPDVPRQPVLGGRLDLGPAFDIDAFRRIDAAYADEYVVNPFFDRNDFTTSEDVTSTYGLAEITVGPALVVGGVRYEHTRTAFTGRVGDLISDLANQLQADPNATLRDTTGTNRYGQFFPQVVSRVTLPAGFDVRAAVTRTLARPDYLDLVFRENVDDIAEVIERGNPDIRPTTAWNADLSLSQLSPIGLVSAGLFYKELTDFFYDTSFRVEDGPFRGYQVFETVNGDDARVYGVEFEAQLNFTFLPGALSGLLLNANYAYSESEAFFPVQIPDRYDLETFELLSRTETRTERLPNQSPHVLNVSVGYERAGFSGRLSLSHQSAFLAVVPNPVYTFTFDDVDQETGRITATEEVPVDIETLPYTFVDLQVTQELPTPVGDRLRLVLGVNNLRNEPEIDGRRTGEVVFNEEFGFTGDLGLRLTF